MISSISWVPKGVSKTVPVTAEPPSKEEIEEILKLHALNEREIDGEDDADMDDADMDDDSSKQADEVAQAKAAAEALGKPSKTIDSDIRSIADGLEELDMEHYDDEDDDDAGFDMFSKGFSNLYYPSNEMDPNLKENIDDDSEEEDDIIIKPDDVVIVCARNEDEVSHLEIWILEEIDGDSNMYVHHDIIIPAFPLCTAWMDCPIKGGERGNFVAVGSMEPSIEIWDLDIMDEVQPTIVLGGISEKKKKGKKGKKKSIKYKKDSHTDAVLGLAWNKEYRNLLASASADKLVKIWDVATEICTTTMNHHSDKVQSVAWNHHASQVLLTGSFDHSVVMKDVRTPDHAGFRWSVSSDVETVAWDPHTEHSFVASLEDGTVVGFDLRAATSNPSSDLKSVFTLHAHDKAVCSISYNPAAPNLLATGSTDKMVKLWDLSNNQPSSVSSKNPGVGAVFSICFSEESPFKLAIGGSKGRLEIWDTIEEDAVVKKYGKFRNQRKP
ncbi:uncharacterized WD repeat-containing protein C17D11.16-like isoform X2 [Impatiens glandulifera]|uniref:uncharacterized WD repeat-containing protein C17D11.16-like isoform X2 n=1 Tax=Impatiens glandulifera TaxID=253017 RepID=UPI001FB074F9|nr:uncharacterized WD repeat-containing protein C17D11.16-like isoform X2 [Impatiens glandulifera]